MVSDNFENIQSVNLDNAEVNILVSNFVEVMRVEQRNADEQERQKRLSSANNQNRRDFEVAQNKTGRAVLEVEKFKASIAKPGTQFLSQIIELQVEQIPINQVSQEVGMNIPNTGAGVSGDDFFHLTCHIEPNLIHKIEKGEFVELEKLLPKEKLGSFRSEDNHLEWVQRDRNTFLVPAQKDNKIGSFRKWEQAF